METIAKLVSVIRNLYQQWKELRTGQSNDFKKFIVNHGQGLNEADFNHLNSVKGGHLSFNKFLSTSKGSLTNRITIQNYLSINLSRSVPAINFICQKRFHSKQIVKKKRQANYCVSKKFFAVFSKMFFLFLTTRIQLSFNNVCSITIYDLSPTLW